MFKDKVIIITGGSSGLGKDLARRLVEKGGKVALIARDPAKLEAVRSELASAGGRDDMVRGWPGDVSDRAAVTETIKDIGAAWGPPGILINSAGILREGYFEDQTEETFREVMDINFFGTVHCIRACLPHFKRQGHGRIVNICSSGGLVGAFGYTAYCSSKFAVTGLTESLRAEFAPVNIKLHLVCPPEFKSPMLDIFKDGRTPENKAMVHTLPVMETEDVARETIAGIERGRYLIVPGAATRAVTGLARWLPGLSRAVVDYRVGKIYQGPGDKN